MNNENNNQYNNEARENHEGQSGHGQRRPYNRPKNYKYKPQHRNTHGRKPIQDRKAVTDKEKSGKPVPFKNPVKSVPRKPKKPTSRLKIIPLGGLEQIGMNITAFEYEDSIVVVDCGLAFPEDDMLGIDLVIPDVTYLKENISKVKGFVITHGHEDHIGALPYVLKDVNVPVYSTKLTIALIANKLKEHNMTRTTKLKEVKHGQVINLGDFSIEFIKTNHSIQDASALAIYSPAGIVVHTGDFKVDYTPVFGDAIDLQRFAEIGKKGVLALMCDSTNAERSGFTMSERSVGHVFDNLFYSCLPVSDTIFIFLIPVFKFSTCKCPYISPFQFYISAIRVAIRIFVKSIEKYPAIFIINGIRFSFIQAYHRENFILIDDHGIFY